MMNAAVSTHRHGTKMEDSRYAMIGHLVASHGAPKEIRRLSHEELLAAHQEQHPGRHESIQILEELRDSLPLGHPEKPGVIRAIEVLRHGG